MKLFIKILFFILLLLPFGGYSKEAREVDVKEIVLNHINDSYEWHIITARGKHISIPLPVIAYSQTSGWNCFMSGHLHSGHEYRNFSVAQDGKYKGKLVERLPDGSYVRPWDFSITKTVTGLFINCAILLWLVLGVSRKYRNDKPDTEAKRGLAGVVEVIVNFVIEDVIKPCLGDKYLKFTPFLLTIFFFILINNLMGLIPLFPAGVNVTGNISVTLVLAVSSFVAVNLFGSKHYWKDIFWPDVPTWLKVPLPLMPLLELIGIFTKPFSLMIRLFANIMAGHAVILILICIVFATVKLGYTINGTMSAVSVLLCIFMNCLELMVAFLQAFVFTMLTSVFIGFAQIEGEHTEKHQAEEVPADGLKEKYITENNNNN